MPEFLHVPSGDRPLLSVVRVPPLFSHVCSIKQQCNMADVLDVGSKQSNEWISHYRQPQSVRDSQTSEQRVWWGCHRCWLRRCWARHFKNSEKGIWLQALSNRQATAAIFGRLKLVGRGATINLERYIQILKKLEQIRRVRPNMQMNHFPSCMTTACTTACTPDCAQEPVVAVVCTVSLILPTVPI
jgi:hypothetical protein